MNIIPKFLQIETTATPEHSEIGPGDIPDFDIGPDTTEGTDSDIIHPRGNQDETINFLQALSANAPETLARPPRLPHDRPIHIYTHRPMAAGNSFTIPTTNDVMTDSQAPVESLPSGPADLDSPNPAIIPDAVHEIYPEAASAPQPKITSPETMPATPSEITYEFPSTPSHNMEPAVLQGEAPDTIVSVRPASSAAASMSPDNAPPNTPILVPNTAHKDTYLKSPQPQNPLPDSSKLTVPQIDQKNDINRIIKSAGTIPIAKLEFSDVQQNPTIEAVSIIRMPETQIDVELPKTHSGDIRLVDPKVISATSFMTPSALTAVPNSHSAPTITPTAPDFTNAKNSKPVENTPIMPQSNVADTPVDIEAATPKAVEAAIKNPDVNQHMAVVPTIAIAEKAEATTGEITPPKDTRHLTPVAKKPDTTQRMSLNITAVKNPEITTEFLTQTTLVTYPATDIPVKAIPTLLPTPNSTIHPAVQTVAQTLIKAQETQSGLSVRLDPPEMGRVFIEFQFESDRSVTAIIRSEVAETATLLKDKADIFLQLLKESGFDSVNLSFEQNQNSKQKPFAFEQQEKPPVFFRADHDEDHLSGAAPVPAQIYKLSPGTHIDLKL